MELVYFAHGYSAPLGAGLRGGGLTGRRAVALAALLLCSAVAWAHGKAVPYGSGGRL